MRNFEKFAENLTLEFRILVALFFSRSELMLVVEDEARSAWYGAKWGVFPKVGGRISSRRSNAKKTIRTRSFWRLSKEKGDHKAS